MLNISCGAEIGVTVLNVHNIVPGECSPSTHEHELGRVKNLLDDPASLPPVANLENLETWRTSHWLFLTFLNSDKIPVVGLHLRKAIHQPYFLFLLQKTPSPRQCPISRLYLLYNVSSRRSIRVFLQLSLSIILLCNIWQSREIHFLQDIKLFLSSSQWHTKPDQNTWCYLIDTAHYLNLCWAPTFIFLVTANGIDPHCPVVLWKSQVTQCGLKADRNLKPLAIKKYSFGYFIAPKHIIGLSTQADYPIMLRRTCTQFHPPTY